MWFKLIQYSRQSDFCFVLFLSCLPLKPLKLIHLCQLHNWCALLCQFSNNYGHAFKSIGEVNSLPTFYKVSFHPLFLNLVSLFSCYLITLPRLLHPQAIDCPCHNSPGIIPLCTHMKPLLQSYNALYDN